MSFANLSLMGVLLGLAGLAAVLYLLQQLRIRYSEKLVPTTMFWAAAVREAPVRVFRKRFRHLLAYLLSLLIVSLLWLGFAGPETTESRSGGYHVLFLDGSALMTGGDLMADSIEALKSDLSGLPQERREVIWGGAYNLKILDAGEDSLLLDQRLQTLQPEAAPTAVDAQLRLVAQEGAFAEQVNFVIYGQAPVNQAVLDALPPGVTVTRGTAVNSAFENSGIVALGVTEAASGLWDSVDVLVSLSGTQGIDTDTSALSFRLDGSEMEPPVVDQVDNRTVLVRDVPATGGVFEAGLDISDDVPADDTARIRLPERTVIRVAISGVVAEPVWRVIEADPGLQISSEQDADVVIRSAGELFAENAPALELASMASQTAAFAIGYSGDQQAEAALQEAVLSLGLNQVDHTGLATAANRPIEAMVFNTDQRSVSLWGELLGEGFNFTGSRSFPLFVAKSIRWLAGQSQDFPYLAAGRPVLDRPTDLSLGAPVDSAFETLGAEFVPPRAGQLESADGSKAWPVALLSSDITEGRTGAQIESSGLNLSARAAGVGLISWLILAALVALLAEWILYRRGLMP